MERHNLKIMDILDKHKKQSSRKEEYASYIPLTDY